MKIVKTAFAFVFLCFLSNFAYTQESGLGDRYYEEVGGYSLCLPKSWQTAELPGFKYYIFIGPMLNGFTPNMNIIDQQYISSLEEYVDLNITQMGQIFNDFVVVSRTNFSTDNNLSGERLVILNEQYSNKLKQIFYIFAKGDRKIVITCTVPANSGELYDSIFDESIKTFLW